MENPFHARASAWNLDREKGHQSGNGALFENQLRRLRRVPWIPGKIRLLNLSGESGAKPAERIHIAVKMMRAVGEKILFCQFEEPHRGLEPPAVHAVIGPQMLFAEMHKSARQLDQPFVKGVVLVARFQPELFQNVVRLVIFTVVEIGEITEVTPVKRQIGQFAEFVEFGGDAVMFHFFRLAGSKRQSDFSSRSETTAFRNAVVSDRVFRLTTTKVFAAQIA